MLLGGESRDPVYSTCIDLRCPWCGTNLADTGTTMETYDTDLGGHVEGCLPFQEEAQ